MPGLGFYLGFVSRFTNRTGKSFLPELQVGAVTPYILKNFVNPRCPLFCGGAGMVYPKYRELHNIDVMPLQTWDSHEKQSYVFDPLPDLKLFEEASRHIIETEYKDGLRLYLIAEHYFNLYLRTTVFDMRYEKESTVVCKKSGELMEKEQVFVELAKFYPVLDKLMLDEGLLTAREIDSLKNWLVHIFPGKALAIVDQDLQYRPSLEWKENEYFNLKDISDTLDEMTEFSKVYLNNVSALRR